MNRAEGRCRGTRRWTARHGILVSLLKMRFVSIRSRGVLRGRDSKTPAWSTWSRKVFRRLTEVQAA